MTLYLKYRPQTIDDLDLKAVRDSLKSTLSKSDIPHAFLFAGPKGTGKTSAARIVAKALNCEKQELRIKNQGGKFIEPCNECSSCISITKGENLDVVEIDAASHRGIDDIRILREAIKLSPISSSHKIYIIDEAHMLTTEACNALLKILEEPPTHVIFILATTNPEKLIDTIRSRTTLIQFTKATEDDVVRRLRKIADGEKVKVEDGILKLIAHAADGAFRDAVKMFEQIISEEIQLNEESMKDFLFGNKSFDPKEFIAKLHAKDTKGALMLIEHGCSHGVSAKQMAKGVLDQLRGQLIQNIANQTNTTNIANVETIQLIELFSKAYAEIPSAYLEQLPLEIAVVRATQNQELRIKNYGGEVKKTEPEKKIEPPKKGETAPVEETVQIRQISNSTNEEKKIVEPVQSAGQEIKSEVVETKRMTRTTDAVVTDGAFSDAMWVKVLAEVRPKNAGTEALLRTCKPTSFDGKVLGISVYYTFHKERLEALPHRNLLEEALAAVLGSAVRFNCILTDPPQKKLEQEIQVNHETVLTEAKNDDTIVKAAKDIFGS
jgi:DNA polymerase-3 subunit gamma/tau